MVVHWASCAYLAAEAAPQISPPLQTWQVSIQLSSSLDKAYAFLCMRFGVL